MKACVKKLMALAVATMMLCAMIIPVSAVDITINTITNSGKEYAAYRLLNLSTALTCTETGEHAHTDECYTFSYSVNSEYESYLASAAFTADEIAAKTAAGTLGEDIIEYIRGLTSESIRTYGDAVYMALLEAEAGGATFTAKTVIQEANVFENVEQGYYLIAETSAEDNGVSSLIMLDTAGQVDVKVNSKEDIPTVDKKVLEVSDSGDGAYGYWADMDIGDTVTFELTATLPSNIDEFMAAQGEDSGKVYELVFHDTISDSLGADTSTAKVQVLNGNDTITIGEGFSVETGTDCSFEVQIADLYALKDTEGNAVTITKDSAVVVTYSATLNGTAAGVADNAVALEFSNDPYSDGTAKTIPETVDVYTYALEVLKQDDEGQALAGASFKVEKYDNETSAYVEYTNGAEAAVAEVKELTCAEEHDHTDDCYETTYAVQFVGLDAGKYRLTETVVPDGYTGIKPIEFEITSTITEDGVQELSATASDGSVTFNGDPSTYTISVAIQNAQGSELPMTGGAGIVVMSVCAIGLICIGAAIIVIARKKMNQDTKQD